jgi:Icc-related predicted phosphoesterase
MVAAVRLLAFSDLHVDLDAARGVVERAGEADLVIGAGDFASVHRGLEDAIGVLAAIEAPTLLVPGNNETDEALREACRDWEAAQVLHGEAAEIDGAGFFGLGAGVPVTPWDWSFDLDEEEAGGLLERCPEGAVLVSHSPPRGHCDRSGAGQELGSGAVLAAIERARPPLVLCGHIHESWGCESTVGETTVVNLGPEGRVFELPSG